MSASRVRNGFSGFARCSVRDFAGVGILSDRGLSSVSLELLQILFGNHLGRRAIGSDIVNVMGFEYHVYHCCT